MVVRTFPLCNWFCCLHSPRRSAAHCYFSGWRSQYLLIRGPILTYFCKLTPFTLRSVVWPFICSGHTNEMRSCFCCEQMHSYESGFGYGLENWRIMVRFQAGAQLTSSPNRPHWLWKADLQESKQSNCVGDHSLPSGNDLNNAMATLSHTPSWSLQRKLYFHMRVGTLIVATIYLQLIQNRYMFRSFTVLQCGHQHCAQPVASDVEVVGYL